MVQGQLIVDLGTESLICHTKYSDRARYIRLQINDKAELSVTIPRHASQQEVLDFLTMQRQWIRRTLSKIRNSTRVKKSAEPFLTTSLHLEFFNTVFAIRYEWQDVCWCAAKMDMQNQTITFSGNVLDVQLLHETLGRFLIKTAEQYFPAMLDTLSAKTAITYKKCTCRLQYGRWGSCTSRGHISLNAQLLFFPPEEVEYVMIHELCHLRHMNHSPAFHEEVARHLPDWEARRHALQERGRKLPDYLRKF